jgi:hypothetical protein
LVHGNADDQGAQHIRARALSIYRTVLRHSADLMVKSEADHGTNQADWPESARDRWASAARLADTIGDQIYFASGVFQERQGRAPDDHSADAAGRQRLFKEAFDLLERLSELGLPQLSHRLIELLGACADFAPAASFRLLAVTVRASTRYGYQFESMAEGQTTALLSRYLAVHRGLFEQPELAADLLAVLEVFVAAGWPSAWRLVYGLDELYR